MAETKPTSEWYLAKGQSTIRWMCWITIAFFVVLYAPGAVIANWLEDSLLTRRLAIPLFYSFIAVTYSLALLRFTAQLGLFFDKYHKRVRWMTILLGAFGFPFLTVPAFLAISKLTKSREPEDSDVTDE